jgi:hypothetical protein
VRRCQCQLFFSPLRLKPSLYYISSLRLGSELLVGLGWFVGLRDVSCLRKLLNPLVRCLLSCLTSAKASSPDGDMHVAISNCTDSRPRARPSWHQRQYVHSILLRNLGALYFSISSFIPQKNYIRNPTPRSRSPPSNQNKTFNGAQERKNPRWMTFPQSNRNQVGVPQPKKFEPPNPRIGIETTDIRTSAVASSDYFQQARVGNLRRSIWILSNLI